MIILTIWIGMHILVLIISGIVITKNILDV